MSNAENCVVRNVRWYQKRYLKGYKAVDLRPTGALTSSGSAAGYRAVKYRIGHWTRPRVGFGPLAVFASLAEARGFLWNTLGVGGCLIAECYYEPSEDKTLWYLAAGERWFPEFRLPSGTCFAARVFLTRLLLPSEHSKYYLYPDALARNVRDWYGDQPTDWQRMPKETSNANARA